ncbi:MAG: UDP-N-acetylglucosamine 2-epimerase (non-hydrolyzing) [Desulfuromonadales bacterium]|nr:UDP-N-acetylglucosamine 2-epimerase (non-hydrolyzing) [Desulfuromonadales bacterium]
MAMKVMTIVGTRPEIIKMSRVIAEFDRQFKHILVHSGQNYDYELNQIFFDDLGVRKPDHFLNVAGESSAKTIANAIAAADDVIVKEMPDAVMLYGDTNTCMAVIAAKRRRVPVFHMEAGNRCFDQRVPEELNRKVLDHLSDINLVLTEHARRYLLDEGIRPETIMKTGSHMHEVISHYHDKIMESMILEKLGLEEGKFFIVSTHREENIDDEINLNNLIDSLHQLGQKYNYPIIVSTHPRTRKRLESLGIDIPLVRFLPPFGFFDYLKLQTAATCVVSDSGTIAEEASLLNLPAVTIRNAHERPEGMDEGTVVMCGLRAERVLEAIELVVSQHDREVRTIPPVADYEGGPVSKQVARIVQSYVDYVKRTVWHEIPK